MEIKKSLPGLKPGYRYYLQARSVSDSGYSEWSEVFTFDIDALRPAPLPVQSLTAEFDGSTLVIEWDDTNPKLSEDFLDFQIKLTSGVTSVTYYTSSSRFEFSVEANEQAFGIIKSTISIEVRSRNTSGSLSSAATTAASNAAPSTPGGSFNVVGIAQGYTFDFSQITGKPSDYLTTRIFIYENLTGGSPIETVDTTEESFTYITGDYLKRYVTIAYVDIFGGVGGQVSPRQEVQATSPIVIDTSQPILASGSLVAGESIDITGFEIASNVITITATAHGLVTGDDVIISGISRDIDGLYENLTKINDNSFSVTGSNLTNTAGQVTVEAVATKASGKRVVITNDGIAGYIDEGVSFELVNDPSGVNKIGGWKFDDVSIKNAVPVPGLPDRNIELRSDQVSLMTNALIVKNVTQRERSGNIATITLDSTHYFAPGDEVNVENVESSFNGIVDITAVTDTTFSYANVGADVSTTASTGTVSTYYGSGITGACTATCPVIWAGSNDVVEGDLWSERPNAKFIVRNNGFMRATDADITGNINALSGVIGGWTIGENSLYSGYARRPDAPGYYTGEVFIAFISTSGVVWYYLYSDAELSIGEVIVDNSDSNNTSRVTYKEAYPGASWLFKYTIEGSIDPSDSPLQFYVRPGYIVLSSESNNTGIFFDSGDIQGGDPFLSVSRDGLAFLKDDEQRKIQLFPNNGALDLLSLSGLRVITDSPGAYYAFTDELAAIAASENFVYDISTSDSTNQLDLRISRQVLFDIPVIGINKDIVTISPESITLEYDSTSGSFTDDQSRKITVDRNRIFSSFRDGSSFVDTWTNITTFANQFQSLAGFAPCAYKYMPDGTVKLRGEAVTNFSGGVPVDTLIFTLPENYRPTHKLVFSTTKNSGVSTSIVVNTNGEVRTGTAVAQNDWVSLNTVSFDTYL